MMNFIYCFQSEWLKRKRSLASWLVIAGAFFTPVIIIIARLVYNKELYNESMSPTFWQTLWNNALESMSIFLLPLGVILASSLVTQIEFRNNTWKQVHTTPQSLTTIFFAKLAVIVVMLLQFFLLFNIGVYLAGVIPTLVFTDVPYPRQPIPHLYFLQENLKYMLYCLPIIALQYLVSLQSKNFLVPIGAGIALWILSIAVLSWEYGYMVPYTYSSFNYLGSIGRGDPHPYMHLWAIGYFILFTALSYILYINKKEKG